MKKHGRRTRKPSCSACERVQPAYSPKPPTRRSSQSRPRFAKKSTRYGNTIARRPTAEKIEAAIAHQCELAKQLGRGERPSIYTAAGDKREIKVLYAETKNKIKMLKAQRDPAAAAEKANDLDRVEIAKLEKRLSVLAEEKMNADRLKWSE